MTDRPRPDQLRLLDEVRARYGANADEWLATAVARYQEANNEARDRDRAEGDAQAHNNATPDGPIVVDVDGTATRNPDTTREQAKTHTAYGEAAQRRGNARGSHRLRRCQQSGRCRTRHQHSSRRTSYPDR